MNCGAKLPVFAMLIAAFFADNKAGMMFFFTLLSWSFALFAAKIMRSTVLRGPKTPFVMELPPYRLPTLKGLVIHTWERTWQYIKKAGTIILGISIILWTMMTFPRLPEQEIQSFEAERSRVRASFLAIPEAKSLIKDEKALLTLESLLYEYRETVRKEEMNIREGDDHPLRPVVKAIMSLKETQGIRDKEGREQKVALSYLTLEKEINAINQREQEAQLKMTIAGRMGQMLEPLTRLIGFDYRTNIALVGGFAAKEVIVSTLGTAYSLGELDPEKSGFLSERLRKDPGWNPLTAFTLILFIMLYVPCFITVLSIRRESSWRWAGFSMIFNLFAAYSISLIVYQVGVSLGLGL
jgi:ferrous iron transport protein B